MAETKIISKANKVLLAGLGAVLVLVIAAIVLLAITLGRTSNLNTIQATGASPTQQSQPCNQHTVEPFYFSVESSKVQYSAVQNGYMDAMTTLQEQIEAALQTTRSADEAGGIVFDASSNSFPVVILGISPAANGVSVIASTVFMGTSLPSPQAITAALNTTDLKPITVSNGTINNQTNSNTQMCQHVSPDPPGAATTPSPTSTMQATTTCPPPTTAPPPTTTSCPTCSCPTQATTTPVQPPTTVPCTAPPSTSPQTTTLPSTSSSSTAPRTTTPSPSSSTATGATTPPSSTTPGSTTSPPPSYPCKRDILILMDSSLGLRTKDNYLYQIMFISQTLITQWTVSPSQVEANPAVYTGNSHDFNEFGSFGYDSTDELRTAIVSALNFFSPNDPPSIKVGLQDATMKVDVNGWRNGVTRITLLFTSSSDPMDVAAALPYAAQLKSNGSSLIVIGMGPYVNATILAPIASGPGFLFTVPFYNVFLNNTNLANQINTAICAPPPSTTPGPTTTPPTTTIATTTTLPPSIPCRVDVLMLVDVSAGLRSQTNFDDQILFISAALISSGWTVSTLQIEANPVAYEKSNFAVQGSFGYNSATELKEALESIFWLGDTPSIAFGLQELVGDDNLGWRAGVPRIVLLFTSTSDPTDVTLALPFAYQLKMSNHTIIVVGLGPSVNQTILAPLASGTNNTFTSDFVGLATNDALAAQLNAAICRYNPPAQPSTTVVPPTSSTVATSPSTMPSSTSTVASSSATMPSPSPSTTTGTTTPLLSTTSGPTTSPPPSYPCKRDILILIDSSIGLRSMDNYLYQIMFLSQTLITQWTVSPSQVEANPAVYTGNSHDFNEFGSFGYASTDELRRAIVSALNFFSPNDPPSIKVGLQDATMKVDVNGWRDGVTRITMLFTSSSDPMDVAAALPYAAQLKSNGSSLIVIGMGPYVNATVLAPIASGPGFLFTVPFYNVFLNNTNLANQINTAICAPPPSTTPGPTTTPPTTTIATTTTLPPSIPCRVDVLMLVDVSAGLRSQTNFDDQILFISAALISSGWTVSTLQIEANPVSYEKSNFAVQGSFGYDSALELKDALENIFWLGDTPSIAYGLQELVGDDNLGWRAGVPRIVLLFTSTSDLSDVTLALPFANQLKMNNHTIIVVGLGPSVNQTILAALASGANNTFTSDFIGLSTNDALAAQLNAAICGFTPPPPPSTTVTPPTTSTMATSSTMPSTSSTIASSSTTMASSSTSMPSSSTSMPSSSTTMASSSTSIPSSSTTMPSSSSTMTSSSSTMASSSTMGSSSTSMASSSTTMPPSSSTTVCTPHTTTTPAVPCQANFIFLIDGSNGMTADQFANQTAFIATLYGTNWTYSEIGVAIGEYDDTSTFTIIAPFGTISDYLIAQSLTSTADQLNDLASITTALKSAGDSIMFPDARPCVPQTTILFTSTSNETDIANAIPYAAQLNKIGQLLIVAMGPNAPAAKFQRLSTLVFSWNDFSNVPGGLGAQIAQSLCPVSP